MTKDELTVIVKNLSILDDNMLVFLKFENSVSGHDVIVDGFVGSEINQEIKRREMVLFNALKSKLV